MGCENNGGMTFRFCLNTSAVLSVRVLSTGAVGVTGHCQPGLADIRYGTEHS